MLHRFNTLKNRMFKRSLLLLVPLLLVDLQVSAQIHDSFDSFYYQGVARDASGDPIANQSINLRFLIGWGTSIAYREEQATTTNAQGLFSVRVGQGTYLSGNFTSYKDIPFSVFYQAVLAVSADFSGGTNFQSLGAGQHIKTIPLAKIAGEAIMLIDSAIVVEGGTFNPDPELWTNPDYQLGVGTTTPDTKLDVAGNVRVSDGDNPNGADPSAALEISSTTGALLMPRMSTAQRDALTATPGMMIYNTDVGKFQGYVGSNSSTVLASSYVSSGTERVSDGLAALDLKVLQQNFRVSHSGTMDEFSLWIDDATANTDMSVVLRTVLPNSTITSGIFSPVVGKNTFSFATSPALLAGTDYQLEFSPASAPLVFFDVEVSTGDTGGHLDGDMWTRDLPATFMQDLNDDIRFEVRSTSQAPAWVDLH